MAKKRQPTRPDGYYWVRYLLYGTFLVLLYTEGGWHDSDELTEAEVEVLAGPLPEPTDEDLARQPAHFAEQCRVHAIRDGVENPVWNGVVEGAYWVRRQSRTQMEIAQSFEGIWRGLSEYEEDLWDSSTGEPNPDVLFGPLLPPTGLRRHAS